MVTMTTKVEPTVEKWSGKQYLEGAKLREHLMEKFNSKCFWCEKTVKIYPEIFGRDLKKGEHMPNDAATIEHMMDGVSGYKEPDPDGKYKVLACYYCNHMRSRQLSKVIAQKSAWLVKQAVQEAKAERDREMQEVIKELKDIDENQMIKMGLNADWRWWLGTKLRAIENSLSILNTKASLKQEEEHD